MNPSIPESVRVNSVDIFETMKGGPLYNIPAADIYRNIMSMCKEINLEDKKIEDKKLNTTSSNASSTQVLSINSQKGLYHCQQKENSF